MNLWILMGIAASFAAGGSSLYLTGYRQRRREEREQQERRRQGGVWQYREYWKCAEDCCPGWRQWAQCTQFEEEELEVGSAWAVGTGSLPHYRVRYTVLAVEDYRITPHPSPYLYR